MSKKRLLPSSSKRRRRKLRIGRIATCACKAAVKGNTRISREEAEELIGQLLKLDNPFNCPHGRPVIISMTKYELERKFKRVI